MQETKPDDALTDSERNALRQFADQYGERTAITKLGLSRHTFARCVAGLSVRRGTIALVRMGLNR